MDPKISPRFWVDLVEQAPEVKLTMLWAITNPETAASLLGIFTWRPRQFMFETGLEPAWFEKTRAALPNAFLVVGDRVLLRNFLRYQVAQLLGKDGRSVNNFAKGLWRAYQALPEPLRRALVEINPMLAEALQRLDPEGGYLSLKGREREALVEGLLSPPQGVSHPLSPSLTTQGGVGGADEPHVPSVEEFVARFAADGIPEEWLCKQWAWFDGNRAWLTPQGQLKRYEHLVRARWTQDRPTWRPADASPSPKALNDLETQLAQEKDPDRRAALRAQIKNRST